jgi:hypothetical protein
MAKKSSRRHGHHAGRNADTLHSGPDEAGGKEPHVTGVPQFAQPEVVFGPVR